MKLKENEEHRDIKVKKTTQHPSKPSEKKE